MIQLLSLLLQSFSRLQAQFQRSWFQDAQDLLTDQVVNHARLHNAEAEFRLLWIPVIAHTLVDASPLAVMRVQPIPTRLATNKTAE